MANDLTKNPWVVDTASGTAILTSFANVRSIQWVSPTSSVGDEAVVADQTGTVFWRKRAQGANTVYESEFVGFKGREMNGLLVPTLSSGTLYITFETRRG